MGMSRRIVRNEDRVSRPELTVVHGGAGAPPSDAPAGRAGATEVLARRLLDTFGEGILFLFHRRIPGPSGDLPIIAVGSDGVHLIEPRAYPGKRIRATPDGSAFLIDRVRHHRLAEQMQEHAEAIQAAVATGPLPEAPVHTSYCFVEGRLPWRPLEVDGVRVHSVSSLLRRLRARGPLDERDVEAVHRDLSARLLRS